ncbi:hypothetical protein ARMSODRAFT_983412 [Armillaria solidipes]|uniref:Uncharacterized protein n=1 Tax=Armillaria solidipes TaxID=1076256 RepID=A0A2H3AJ75_9AGAR|nr:hypothetical protein ARMSODRAFT_983412 [Armillaria solidipes]
MDKFYNKKDASEYQREKRRTANQSLMQETLCRQLSSKADRSSATVWHPNRRLQKLTYSKWLGKASMMSVDNDQTWRMVETDNENQLEEMVFTLQGIIAKKDLPLVNDIPLERRRDNYGFLQQNVRLTGLGCQAFKDTADTILEAQLVFERQFPKGMFQEWTPDNTDDNMSINISNCYLKSCTTHPQEEASFEKGVDPKSILAAACTKRNLIHTEDNKIFRPGDFIEIQLSHEELSHAAWTPSINELEKRNGGLGYNNGSTHNSSSDEDKSTSEHGSLDAET